MWGGGEMRVRSDVTSGRNRRWEWRLDSGYAEDGKTTSDASGRGARASDAGLIFADVLFLFNTRFLVILSLGTVRAKDEFCGGKR